MTDIQIEAEIENLFDLISKLREDIDDLKQKINSINFEKQNEFRHIGRWENQLK